MIKVRFNSLSVAADPPRKPLDLDGSEENAV